jgi:hypothetical protein
MSKGTCKNLNHDQESVSTLLLSVPRSGKATAVGVAISSWMRFQSVCAAIFDRSATVACFLPKKGDSE